MMNDGASASPSSPACRGSTVRALFPNTEVAMKRFVLSLLLLSFASSFLAGCHTVAGVGKDVKEVGEEVEETAEGH
jgi:predicted small secreted protein